MDTGDFLVLYTDGLTEAENPEGNILDDLDRFVKIVENYAEHNPGSMKDMIMKRGDPLVRQQAKR